MITARAAIVEGNEVHPVAYQILDGEYTGGLFYAIDVPRALVGCEARVRFCPDDQFAYLVDSPLEYVVDRAEDAFWTAVAEAYPEISTGDLDPAASHALHTAMIQAVRAWLDANR